MSLRMIPEVKCDVCGTIVQKPSEVLGFRDALRTLGWEGMLSGESYDRCPECVNEGAHLGGPNG